MPHGGQDCWFHPLKGNTVIEPLGELGVGGREEGREEERKRARG